MNESELGLAYSLTKCAWVKEISPHRPRELAGTSVRVRIRVRVRVRVMLFR